MKYVRRTVNISQAASESKERDTSPSHAARAQAHSSMHEDVGRTNFDGHTSSSSRTRHRLKEKRLEPIKMDYEHKKRWWFDDALVRHSDKVKDLSKAAAVHKKVDKNKKAAETTNAEVPSFSSSLDDKEVNVFKR